MKYVRWLLVLPGGLLASLLAHLALSWGVGSAWLGLEGAANFAGAIDMNGEWFGGTAVLILSRGGSSAAGILAGARIAPSHQSQTAWTLFWIIAVIVACVFILAVLQNRPDNGVSFWYRAAVDMAAVLAGMGLAASSIHKSTPKTEDTQ